VTPRTLHDPVRSRVAFGAAALVLGAVLRWGLGLPLATGYFVLVVVWMTASLAHFRFYGGREAGEPFLPRFLLFAAEVVAATVLGRMLGASSWLLILFVLVPALEWTLLFPGRRGLAGSVGAVLAAGAFVVAEALGFVPPASLFPGVDGAMRDPTYALAAFLVGASLVAGLSVLVGRYAEAGRSRQGEMEEANAKLSELAEQLGAAQQEAEDAYGRLQGAQADVVNSAKMAALGQLVAGVAHEINTPMGALNSNHDVIRRALDKLQVILEDERVDPDELEQVRRIVKALHGVQSTNDMAVERMGHIVKSLRTFGRPDRSEVGPLDLTEGLDSTLTILSHEVRGRIDIVREYGDVTLAECFPNRLNQVFMNLLMNACQAIEESGTITVRTALTEGGDAASIQVEDTGSGIPPETLAKIFEPGFTTKGSRVGMGMGLLISRQIVEQHGGQISVESTPGEGTTFTLTLPLRLAAVPEVAG